MSKNRAKLIAYYRVSTARQGLSGLGLDAQREAVQRYAAKCDGEIIAEYTEVESGRRADRPDLVKAVAHARRCGGKLVIAKLDRLGRNLAFISALMDNGFEFVCCDNQEVNRLTLHVLAAFAENEAMAISARTKEALAAAKRRGVKLGSSRLGFWTKKRAAAWLAGLPKGREISAQVRRAKAVERVRDLLPMMQERRAAGISLAAIADELNQQGQQTPRGGRWVAASVLRALRLAPPAK